MWRSVVIVIFGLAACSLADRQIIEDRCGPITNVPEDETGSLTYFYPSTSPGEINCTVAQMVRCNQTIRNEDLMGRTYYITQDKAFFGMGYNPRSFQTFNIQCPPGHYLNIAFLRPTRFSCPGDSVNVITSREETGPLCTDDDIQRSFLSGRGAILSDGRARVDFCSDDGPMNIGFVIRATCFNPVLTVYFPGCVDFEFTDEWDPEFTTIDQLLFEMVPTRFTPHKRSAEEPNIPDLSELENPESREEQENKRLKRGIIRHFFSFENGTAISYVDNILTFEFPNGTVRQFAVFCLYAFNSDIGTRIYTRNATRMSGDMTRRTEITFYGPGDVDIFMHSGNIFATLNWTFPQPFDLYLESQYTMQQNIAMLLYEYINNNWLRPYPVIDEVFPPGARPIPLPGDQEGGSGGVRRRSQVGIEWPVVQEGSVCREGIIDAIAPLKNATINPRLMSFCLYFQNSCDPILRTACREIILLDPRGGDPSVMMMMGRGGD